MYAVPPHDWRSPTAEELALDENQSRGQVRTVDAAHVHDLKVGFTRNRPDVLDLVVWYEAGVLCFAVLWLLVVRHVPVF